MMDPNEPTISKSFSERLRVWPGSSYPLGATWDGAGKRYFIVH